VSLVSSFLDHSVQHINRCLRITVWQGALSNTALRPSVHPYDCSMLLVNTVYFRAMSTTEY